MLLTQHSQGYRIHYCNVIMGAMASQITSPTIVCSIVHAGADQRKHQSSASLAFERWIRRWPLNSPHKRPVMQKIFPFDDVIMSLQIQQIPLNIHAILFCLVLLVVHYPLILNSCKWSIHIHQLIVSKGITIYSWILINQWYISHFVARIIQLFVKVKVWLVAGSWLIL